MGFCPGVRVLEVLAWGRVLGVLARGFGFWGVVLEFDFWGFGLRLGLWALCALGFRVGWCFECFGLPVGIGVSGGLI